MSDFSFFLTLKGYWSKANKNRLYRKKIPLVARPCKEDSRRNRGRGSEISHPIASHLESLKFYLVGRLLYDVEKCKVVSSA